MKDRSWNIRNGSILPAFAQPVQSSFASSNGVKSDIEIFGTTTSLERLLKTLWDRNKIPVLHPLKRVWTGWLAVTSLPNEVLGGRLSATRVQV